ENVAALVRLDGLEGVARANPLAADDERDLEPVGLELAEAAPQLLALGRPGRVALDRLVCRRRRPEDSVRAHDGDSRGASADERRSPSATAPASDATTAVAPKNSHIASSPDWPRSCRATSGPTAKPADSVLPKAPMYAPRRSSGASAAAAAIAVGAHSISPKTKTITTAAIVQRSAPAARERSDPPITSTPTGSLTAAGTPASRRVSRSWSSATSAGLIAISPPQSAVERP